MRFLSTQRAFALLAIVLTSTATAQGGVDDPELDNIWSGNGSGRPPEKGGDDDEPVRLIFKYKNQRGKSEAAAMGHFNVDIPELSLGSVSTTRRNWQALQNNPNIELNPNLSVLNELFHYTT